MLARLNIALLLALLFSALLIVTNNHRARKLVSEFEREQERMRALEVEWGQLQLEQGTLAAHARIEQIAREKLGMRPPRPNQVFAIQP